MTAPNSGPASYDPAGGLIGAGGTNTSTDTTINSDGTPNYGSIIPTSVRTDTSGAIDVWNLPSWVYDYEKQVAKPIYWTENPEGGNGTNTDIAPQFNNRAFRKANGLPEEMDKPQSFDTNVSAEELMKQFAAMDPSQLQPLQGLLANGPWGASKNYVASGVFDQNTEQMLSNAIVQYLKVSRGAGKAISFMQFLTDGATSNVANGGGVNGSGGTGGGAGQVINLTDPAQIRSAAQQAAQEALGHVFTNSELDSFVNSFQAQQTAAQQVSGGQDSTMPDLTAEAMQEAQTGANAQEFSNHQALGYMDTFLNMFLPSGSNRGGVNPVTPVTGEGSTPAPEATAQPAGRG